MAPPSPASAPLRSRWPLRGGAQSEGQDGPRARRGIEPHRPERRDGRRAGPGVFLGHPGLRAPARERRHPDDPARRSRRGGTRAFRRRFRGRRAPALRGRARRRAFLARRCDRPRAGARGGAGRQSRRRRDLLLPRGNGGADGELPGLWPPARRAGRRPFPEGAVARELRDRRPPARARPLPAGLLPRRAAHRALLRSDGGGPTRCSPRSGYASARSTWRRGSPAARSPPENRRLCASESPTPRTTAPSTASRTSRC